MSNKIIILGSGGFIGSWLLQRFSSDNFEVFGYSSKECDLLDKEQIAKVLSFITTNDIIIFASCITRIKENNYDSMIKNITMMENLLNFLENHPCKYFIFFSTVEVYGFVQPYEKVSEKLLLAPRDYYSISKATNEYLLNNFCLKKKLPCLILRLPGVYGPGDKGKSTINKLVESAIFDKKITVFGGGSDKRDFVYVDDIYKILNESIKKKINLTLNLATGQSYKISEIASLLGTICKGNFFVEYLHENKAKEKRVKDLVYDVTLLEKSFSEIKLTNLKEGLLLYLNWFLVNN